MITSSVTQGLIPCTSSIVTSASCFLCSLELVLSLFSLLPCRRDEEPSLDTPSFLLLLSLLSNAASSCLPEPSFLKLPSRLLLSDPSRLVEPSLPSCLALAAFLFSLAFRVYIEQNVNYYKLYSNIFLKDNTVK